MLRVLHFTIILLGTSLRVQQRGADVRFSDHDSVQVKAGSEPDPAPAPAASAPSLHSLSQACALWMIARGPIYDCVFQDFMYLAHFQSTHAWKCFRGWDTVIFPNTCTDVATPVCTDTTAWPYPTTAQVRQDGGKDTFTERMNCILNNPLKLKALFDPFHLQGNRFGTSPFASVWRDWVTRFNIFDPFNVWSAVRPAHAALFDAGSPAMVKWFSGNAATVCTGTPTKTYVYSSVHDVHFVEEIVGLSQMQLPQIANENTCYVRLEYTGEFSPTSNSYVTKIVGCRWNPSHGINNLCYVYNSPSDCLNQAYSYHYEDLIQRKPAGTLANQGNRNDIIRTCDSNTGRGTGNSQYGEIHAGQVLKNFRSVCPLGQSESYCYPANSR